MSNLQIICYHSQAIKFPETVCYWRLSCYSNDPKVSLKWRPCSTREAVHQQECYVCHL